MRKLGSEAAARRVGTGTASRAVSDFAEALQHEAESAWRFPRRLALALFALPFVGAPLVALSHLHKPLFLFLTAEDRFLEWSQFVGYAGAAVLAASVSYALARRGAPIAVSVAWGLLALGCLGVAGEEISWGQRIFDWGTPELLQGRNQQDETNVHNIRSIQTLNNITLLLLGLYGSMAPFLARRARPARFTWLFVPPLFLTGAFFVLFAFKLGRFTIIPRYNAIVEFGEWPEFGLALALFVYTALALRRLRAAGFS